MCGIFGAIGPSLAENLRASGWIDRGYSALRHRGPDDHGCWSDDRAILGHTRLSIIDLEGGQQPLASEDGSVVVVFNGEIYNYLELREHLKGKGHVFATQSDTEAIVHLYEELGAGCVKRLRGMFSFAVWDSANRTLVLARDRLGKKPLFYACTPQGLAFASELKVLLDVPGLNVDPDRSAIDAYLSNLYVPSPRTIAHGIRKLPPAHTLAHRNGRTVLDRYWSVDYADKRTDREDVLVGELRELLADAVRLRLVGEVPLGAFLSGGLDSSTVVALMAVQSRGPVRTFSIGFEEQDFSELRHARVVADMYATDHHEFVVRPNAVEIVPDLVWHLDEPFGDSSAVPTYYVSRETRHFVTVALNGDGGDETFAGYERYLASLLAEDYAKMPALLRGPFEAALRAMPQPKRRGHPVARLQRFVDAAGLPAQQRYARWMATFSAQQKEALYTPEFAALVAGSDPSGPIVEAMQRASATSLLDRLLACDTALYLPEDLLVKADRMTMAHSLEARSPFLDQEVVEFAASLPENLKLRGRTTKYILRRAAQELLPDTTLSRGKQGFGVPVGRWLSGPLKSWLQGVLCSGAALGRGYFQPQAVQRLIDENAGGRANHGQRLWALAMLELWHLVFVDKTVHPGVAPW